MKKALPIKVDPFFILRPQKEGILELNYFRQSFEKSSSLMAGPI